MPDTSPNFDRLLGFILADLSRLLHREFDRRVRGLGLTRAQWLILYEVARHEGGTQSDLAEALQLGKMTVGRHTDRLVRTGWLRRQDDPEDGRAYRLYLKPKARRTIVRILAVTADFRESYFHGLSPRRREALFASLFQIKRNLVALEAARAR
jgi:DNA-binding MarR family transcriptional regulator